MTRVTKTILFAVGCALVATAAAAVAPAGDHKTPDGFSYEIKDGKRVPKAERVTNADGSWREESRQGKCSTVKEMSATGELKISRKCD